MSGLPRILTVAVICVFFVVIFLGLGLGSSLDRNLHPNRPDQCEALATDSDPTSQVLEPQNTWSNFGYLIVGVLILYRSRNLLGAAVGMSSAFTFLFSALYHGKLSGTLQTLDVAWIYCLVLALIAYAVQNTWFNQWADRPHFTIFVALGTAGLGMLMGALKNQIFESTATTLVLAAVLAVLLAVALINAGPRKSWDTGAIVTAIVAVIAAGLPALFFKFSDGKSHILADLCNPKGVIQAHAIWHVMSALLVLVVYDLFAHYSGQGRIFVNWLTDE